MHTGKKIIAIASVLKPVNDPRMLLKLASTLAADTYKLHVIGQPSPVHVDGIYAHHLPQLRRISIGRLLAPLKVLRIVLRIRPHVLIITTHELLWAGAIAKLMLRCRLIYDIQENYFANILYTQAFPSPLRPLLAFYVRLKETLLSFLVDRFLLAERSYENELPFARKRSVVLENKALRSSVFPRQHEKKHIQLIFTGTLDDNTGVFDAIALAGRLHEISQDIRLKIIGFCSRAVVLQRIREAIARNSWLELEGGDVFVPHERIMREIATADFGIIAYPINASTAGSIPTKLYEYLAAGLPILLFEHPPWEALCREFQACIIVPGTYDAASILREMQRGGFYPRPAVGVFWEEESPKLLETIRPLLS